MFCIHCGKKIEEDSRFCPFCGSMVADGNSVLEQNPAKEAERFFVKHINKCRIALASCGVAAIAVTGIFVYHKVSDGSDADTFAARMDDEDDVERKLTDGKEESEEESGTVEGACEKALAAYRKYAADAEYESYYYLVDMDNDSVPECLVWECAGNGDLNYVKVLGYKEGKLVEVERALSGCTVSTDDGRQDGTVYWYADKGCFGIYLNIQTWWGDLLKDEKCIDYIYKINSTGFEKYHTVYMQRDNNSDWMYAADDEDIMADSKEKVDKIHAEFYDASVMSRTPVTNVSIEEAIDAYMSAAKTAGAVKEEVSETKEQSIISGHSIVRDDFSRSTDNGRKIEIYFDKVIFEGKDENIVYWLNGQIESIEGSYRKENERYIDNDLENLQQSTYDSNWSFAPYEIESVYYDDDYVSVGWSGLWYAGGVASQVYYSLNYDLRSKTELKLTDILGDNAYNMIVDALMKEDDSGWLSSQIEYGMVDETPFNFDENNVYVAVNPPGMSASVYLTFARP